jgi:hypothetical protein
MDDRPLPDRALDVDRLLTLASEAGLAAAVTHHDLSSAEVGVLGLLSEFQDDVPGAKAAARTLAKRRQPKRTKRYRVNVGEQK